MSRIADDLASLAVDIERLEPMPGNPRRGDVDAIARSYRMFGQRKPIVARRVGDGGIVIAGNHGLAAARLLGWRDIAVVWVDDDDLTAKAFALADNRTGELGRYDDDALLALMIDVETDAELWAATGWTDAELAKLASGDDDVRALDTASQLDDTEYSLLVTCRDEHHQRELLQRFEQEGLIVKVLMA